VTALAFLLLSQAGCSRAQPATDLDLRLAFGLEAGPARTFAQRVLLSNLYSEPLVALDWVGRPSGRLAEAWEWQDEGRTLVLRLRENIKFHDGTPVDSDSVVAALQRNSRAMVDQPIHTRRFAHVTSIEAADPRTITIRLSQPDAFLIDELFDVTIVSEHDRQIGTGPFRIVSREPARVERFEDYYRGMPIVRTITITPFDTQRSAWAALMRGDIDIVQEVDRDAVEFIEGSTQVRTYSSLRPYYIAFVFNLHHPALGNVEVRQAISEAVNRDEIIRDALRGYAEPAVDPIWPAHWAYRGATRTHIHNPAVARDRLDRAGLPVSRADGTAMPSRMKLTCLFSDSEPQFERIALMLQRQLARVGIDLELRGVPITQAVEQAGTGEFETLLVPIQSGRSLSTTYAFWRSPRDEGALLNSGYAGADEILDHLRTVRSDGEIRAAVADLQQRFYEDAPAVFIAWQQTTRAVDARIDVSEGAEPDVFTNIWRWRPAAAPKQAGR
jgi:peptide/nickel transport system substrate-binding protein